MQSVPSSTEDDRTARVEDKASPPLLALFSPLEVTCSALGRSPDDRTFFRVGAGDEVAFPFLGEAPHFGEGGPAFALPFGVEMLSSVEWPMDLPLFSHPLSALPPQSLRLGEAGMEDEVADGLTSAAA